MRAIMGLALAALCAACGEADDKTAGAGVGGETQSYAEAVEGLDARGGFIDVHVGTDNGEVLAGFPAPGEDGVSLRAIYAQRLTAGLGSNPLGLDRGWGDSGQLVSFRRVGDQLVMAAENTRYRASADSALEREAVDESFADSFLWAGDIVDEGPEGVLLVDLSTLAARDGLGLAQALEENGNSFSLDAGRSMIDASSVKVFPDNLEFDAFLTFTSENPGGEVRATAANPNAVTLVQHHSLVRLPDEEYAPRVSDPRVGNVDIAYYDYSAALADPVIKRLSVRHRTSTPIVYYVDPGAPEPVKSALIEGASWWEEAFAAAGYPDGFRVEELPVGADPLDIRYNVIQWVHRQTRGWSYGGGVVDPRTGERIKGHVILGSQRVRQDIMIFEGLAGVEKTGSGDGDDPVQLALDRIRQLAAHEVGHAIGLGHNFAASAYGRQSVMDYPAPWVKAENGELDFSDTYDSGAGAWDVFAVRWLYSEPPEDMAESEYLDRLIEQARRDGLVYIADSDGRAAGAGHARASVWDNGADAAAELRNVMAVRRIALENFGPGRIEPGAPIARLREVIVPIYLYHRYQTAAAAKLIGGLDFAYAARGDGTELPRAVPMEDQRRALDAVLATLAPEALDLPGEVLNVLAPGNPDAAPPGAETFANRAEPAFDLISAAESAADISLGALLDPRRAERLVQQKDLTVTALGFVDVLDAVTAALFNPAAARVGRLETIRRAVQGRYAAHLMGLDADPQASLAVRSQARLELRGLATRLRGQDAASRWLADRIDAHLARPAAALEPQVEGPKAPPGSPIGAGE